MVDQDRSSGGKFESKVSDEMVLEVLRKADTPVLSTQAVADGLPVTRQAAYYRLQNLHDDGKVDRMKVGSRAVVWWVADELQ